MPSAAFLAGILKEAGLVDWARSNVIQPFAQGIIDENYGGLGKYNPQSGKVEANTSNALLNLVGIDSVKGPSVSASPLQRGLYNIGRSDSAGLFSRLFHSKGHVNDVISQKSNGLFSMDGKNVRVNYSQLPNVLSKVWDAHKGKIIGAGLGVGALALGGMALRSAQSTPQVAAPGGQQAAPFASAPDQPRKSYFDKYQSV